MVVAFHTLMLADCSPFSRLLERLWGINWNGSPEVEGSHELAATCLNLTQLICWTGWSHTRWTNPHNTEKRFAQEPLHCETSCETFVKHAVTCCDTFWIFGALIEFWIGIGMNQYEYVGCAKALLVRQCLQVHGWAGGRTDACSWGSMGDQVQDPVYNM